MTVMNFIPGVNKNPVRKSLMGLNWRTTYHDIGPNLTVLDIYTLSLIKNPQRKSNGVKLGD
jgi:hypothetical protein